MNQLGTRIKSLMNSNGIADQKELAQLAGIPEATLSRIINGKGSTRPEVLKKLCAQFKITLNELTAGVSSPHSDTQNFKNITEVLKFLMKDVSIGQNELARTIGISQQAINKILSGETLKPSENTLKKLANYFVISTEQLEGKIPIGNTRTKGSINEDDVIKKEIPLLDWDDLPMLPESLQNNSKQFLSKIYGEEIYATRVPRGVISMTSVIKKGRFLVVDFGKVAKKGIETGDTCIILSRKSILIGDVYVEENQITLLPINVNRSAITLTKGQYRVLGVILMIYKRD